MVPCLTGRGGGRNLRPEDVHSDCRQDQLQLCQEILHVRDIGLGQLLKARLGTVREHMAGDPGALPGTPLPHVLSSPCERRAQRRILKDHPGRDGSWVRGPVRRAVQAAPLPLCSGLRDDLITEICMLPRYECSNRV